MARLRAFSLSYLLAPVIVGILGILGGLYISHLTAKDHKLSIEILRNDTTDGTPDYPYKQTIHLVNSGDVTEDDVEVDFAFTSATPPLKMEGPSTDSDPLTLSYVFTVTGKLDVPGDIPGYGRYQANAALMKKGASIDFTFRSNVPVFVTAEVRSRKAVDAAFKTIDEASPVAD
jgi:hypothetical protein